MSDGRPAMEIWLIEHPSRKRIYRLTPDEVDALRAYKSGEADAAQKALCLALLDRARRDKLWFECCCRREDSQYPDFHARRHRNGEYTCANRPDRPNQPDAPVAHAVDCVFRRGEADRPSPARHPDVIHLFVAARNDTPGPNPDARPDLYWRPPSMPAAKLTTTLWGTVSKLMKSARLNLLSVADRHPSPGEWLAEIANAADRLYFPPRVPMSGFLFTDPASWRNDDVAAKLEAADGSGGGPPGALLCWPVDEVSGCVVDPGGEGHVEALDPVVCPSILGRPVIGPYLFLGAVARSKGRWACVDACARPIVALDCPVPVDSDYERKAVGALRRLVGTLSGNPELAALLGGALRVELERPVAFIETTAGGCLPDFVLSVVRPSAPSHLPGGPDDPPHLGRFDPRYLAQYVIEVMGFDDPEYKRKKRRTHPLMRRLGPVKEMKGWEFASRDNDIDRQREEITAEIALDLLRRWRRAGARPAAA